MSILPTGVSDVRLGRYLPIEKVDSHSTVVSAKSFRMCLLKAVNTCHAHTTPVFTKNVYLYNLMTFETGVFMLKQGPVFP